MYVGVQSLLSYSCADFSAMYLYTCLQFGPMHAGTGCSIMGLKTLFVLGVSRRLQSQFCSTGKCLRLGGYLLQPGVLAVVRGLIL